MRVLILGVANHGKDKVAEQIKELTGMDYISSSEIAGKECVYPALKDKYGYSSWQECFDDRENHRIEWRDLIREYCTPDKANLAKTILSKCDIYVGQRCHFEHLASRDLFDVVLWVDATNRVGGTDPSLTIEYDPTYMTWVDNNWSSDYTETQLEVVFKSQLKED